MAEQAEAGDQPLGGVRVVELAQWVLASRSRGRFWPTGARRWCTSNPRRVTRTVAWPRKGSGPSVVASTSPWHSPIRQALHRSGHSPRRGLGRFCTSSWLRPTYPHQHEAGRIARAGLDADALTSRYPALIYARGHGYGAKGPDADGPVTTRRHSGPGEVWPTC